MTSATPHSSLRVAVDLLAPNPYNPRATLAAVEETADRLTNKGIIQPLTIVTREAFLAAHPGHAQTLASAEYVVVDGNRRLAGAKLAGLDELPVHVDAALAKQLSSTKTLSRSTKPKHWNGSSTSTARSARSPDLSASPVAGLPSASRC